MSAVIIRYENRYCRHDSVLPQHLSLYKVVNYLNFNVANTVIPRIVGISQDGAGFTVGQAHLGSDICSRATTLSSSKFSCVKILIT